MRWIWIDKFTEFTSKQSATAVKNVSLAEEHLHEVHVRLHEAGDDRRARGVEHAMRFARERRRVVTDRDDHAIAHENVADDHAIGGIARGDRSVAHKEVHAPAP